MASVYRVIYLLLIQILVLSAATYLHNGIPCDLCPAGTRVLAHCTADRSTRCKHCPKNSFTSFKTYRKTCSPCSTQCRRENEIKVANCTKTSDMKCDCKPGYWFTYDKRTYGMKCTEHSTCEPGYGVKEAGTTKTDTECVECADGYYSSIYSKDYPCQKHTDCEELGKVVKPGTGSKWSDYECIDREEVAAVSEDVPLVEGKRARPAYQTPAPDVISSNADEEVNHVGHVPKNEESSEWTTKDIIFIVIAVVLAIALTIAITLFIVYRRRICQRKSFSMNTMISSSLDTLPRDVNKEDQFKEHSQPLVDNNPIVYSEYELLKKSLHAPLNLSMDDPKRRGLHNMLHSFQQLDDPNAPKTPAKFIGRIRRRSTSLRSVDMLESPPASPANMKIAESMDSVFTFNATELHAANNRQHLLERLNSTAPSGQELPDLPINSTVDDLFLYVSRLLGIKRWKDVIRNMPGKKVSLAEMDQIESTYKMDGYPEVIYQGFCNWRGKNPYHFNVLDAVTVALQKAEKVTLVERLVLTTPPRTNNA